jgi:penicillin-binding protein 1A
MADAPPPTGQKPRRTPFQRLLYWSMVLGVWGLIFVVAFFAMFAVDLPDTSKLYDVKRQPSISYLDRSGALIAVRGSQYAPPVDLDRLPKYVPEAFIAIEDRWYYYHFGFNPWGIVRSQLYNLKRESGPLRGGSTITQQLARNLFLTLNQNYRRKAPGTDPGRLAGGAVLQEADPGALPQPGELRRRRLWHRGRIASAISARARQADPRRGRPAGRPDEGAVALQPRVLHRPRPEARHGGAEPDGQGGLHHARRARRGLRHQGPRQSATLANQRAQYFTDWVDDQVRRLVGEPHRGPGGRDHARPAAPGRRRTGDRSTGVTANKAVGVEQGALVSIDGEGRVRAYVGGTQLRRERVRPRHQWPAPGRLGLQALRLPDGHGGRPHAQTPVVDEPIKIGNWEPHNYTNTYPRPDDPGDGPEAQSINTIAARLANEVGTSNVAATARSLGITSPIQLEPSMALGAVEVSPMEMAQAYAPFSNGGFFAKGYGIERVRTASGKVLYDHGVDKGERRSVIGSPALQYMNQMMRQVIAGRHRRPRPCRRLRHRRQDRHHQRLPRRLVRRLHRRLRHRRLDRQGQQHPDEARSPAAAPRPRSGTTS